MTSKTIQITRWDRGISDDYLNLSDGYLDYCENVKLGKRSAKQISNITTEIPIDTDDVQVLLNKLIRIGGSTYAYGKTTATNYVKVFKISTDGIESLGGSGTYGGQDNPLFAYYNGYIYYHSGIATLGRVVVSTDANDSSWGSFSSSYGLLQGGLGWGSYVYCYSDSTNYIYRIDLSAGTVSPMIYIPIDQTIVELVDYGNLIAIICSSIYEKSKMYLWDGANTETFYDVIDIGNGKVAGADLLDGAITVVLGDKTYRGLKILRYNGTQFQTLVTYQGREQLSGYRHIIPASRVKVYGSYLYFMAYASRPNSSEEYEYSIIKYGREDIYNYNALSICKTLEVGEESSSIDYNDFVIINDEVVSTEDDLKIYATIYTGSNETTSIYSTIPETFESQPVVIETGYYDFGYGGRKNLKTIGISFDKLTTGQSVLLKYKIDGDTSWTSFTSFTSGSYSKLTPNIPFNLIKFRVEGLGGVNINGLIAKAEYSAVEL